MPPVLRPNRSNPRRETKARANHILSNIITEEMNQMVDDNDELQDDVHILERPRNITYSTSASSSSQEDIDISNQPSTSSASRAQIVSMEVIDLDELSIESLSVRNKPFENFLQDISLIHGTRPRENVQKAVDKWNQMTLRQREAYNADNYILKLFTQVHNTDEIFVAIGIDRPKESKPKRQMTQRLRKPIKRLNSKERGSSVRCTPSSWTFKNFLRKIRRTNPGLLTVEAASLWRKMNPSQKELFKMTSADRLKRARRSAETRKKLMATKTKKSARLRSPKRPSRSLPEDDVESESSCDVGNRQLEVWTDGNTSALPQRSSYIARAIDIVKNLFS